MNESSFARFFWRVTACHVVTYFVAGLFAYTLLDYKGLFESPAMSALMKPVASREVALGPALQVVRGLIFALALYPFRRVFLEEPHGWHTLWGLLVGLIILSTAGPSPGSVEGMIYTKIPIAQHLRGWPEVFGQTLAFSALLVAWYRKPSRLWNGLMGIAVTLVVLMSLAGAFLPRPERFR